MLALMESGTHAIFAAAIGRYDTSEVALAPALLERLRPGMLCLADRGFVGLELWQAARTPGADLLWRVRSNQKFPCHRRLPDGSSLSRLRPLIRSSQTAARGRRAAHRVPPERCPRRRTAVPPDHLP